MILRVIIFATIVVGNCCYAKEDDNNFMTAVRSLIYGEQHSANATTQQLSDGLNPGLLPSSAQYPSAPNSYNSYPQFTVGVSSSSSSSPCGLPQQIGTGPYRIPRWYFNPARMRCELFYWSGCCGNGNNFNTFQSCQQICEESPNPCAYGTSTTLMSCAPGSVLSQTCSGQQFCHVGATPQTTVCCNKPATNIDRCSQPLNVGVGNSNLQRWYFNPLTQQCQPCFYKGLQGNENNFLSRQDCENSCAINPCKRGVPYRSQGVTVQCSATNQAICPAGYYCHVGTDSSTSVCCQALGGDPCGQPMDRGMGGAQLSRWYWDQSRQCCLPFSYCGQKGTQNNFLTKQDCEQTCFVFVNPCSLPISMPPQSCSADNPNTCSGGSYCHIGGSPTTTICCPSEGDPCQLPLNCGFGNEALNRWYYNQQTGNCQPFIYLGMKGNQNNFLSQQQCEQSCFINPCAEGNPFIGVDGRTQTCSASQSINMCPSSYWCHVGADVTTTVCCPGASQNSCNLPMSTGEGNANLERFYFDQSSKTCRQFIYNGLKGNQNNFLTLRACQLACQPLDNPCIGQPATTPSGQVLFCSATNKDTCPVNFWCHLGATPETTVCCPGATNPCSVPLAPGTGNAGLARWYYNPDDRQCVPFQYNGKRGNQNNFLSQPECERTCPEQLCLLSIDRGACGGQQTRYAFNRQTSQCVSFTYTGCGGNLNNFETMADCMATCGNVGFRR